MKFIFVWVIVCATVLSFDFVNTGISIATTYSRDGETDRDNFSPEKFTDILIQQNKDVKAIFSQAFEKCDESISVQYNKTQAFYINRPSNFKYVSYQSKCFAGCMMRELGLMTDDGFREELYVTQIQKLMFNYTSFDINEKSVDMKRKILDAIDEHVKRESIHKFYSCFAGKARYNDYQQNRVSLSDICSELIQSYRLAAHKCKNLRDRDGDSCQTSWKIIRCIAGNNYRGNFTAGFYPVLKFGYLILT